MTPRERVARLERLLERVQHNLGRPRVRSLAAEPEKARATEVAPAAVAPPPTPSRVAEPRVQPAPAPWAAEPGSTVQPRPSSIPPEELTDDDLVEVTTLPPAPDTAAAEAPLGATDDEGEEAPASSRRSKVAESLDQAIASAAANVDEVPIHTPPPESGPQEAVLPVAIEALRAPDFPELATDELDRPASLGPTAEQLGETIELDEPMGPDLEVGSTLAPDAPPERPVEELEVALPRPELQSGTFDVSPLESADLGAAPPREAPVVELGPEHTERSELGDAAEVTHVIRVPDKAPETFAELLDVSLGL